MYAVVFHAHQKIDRIAHKHLQAIIGNATRLPAVRHILHFEGKNGPDAAKLKHADDTEQPWHFIDPFDTADTQLHDQIHWHYDMLIAKLKEGDEVRAAFEASWLAHALVDGLTPAHHYPYEKELERLSGETRHSRQGIVGRAFVKGDTRRDSMRRSLRLIGPKGLLTTHAMFEGGAYTIMATLKLTRARPSTEDLQQIKHDGLIQYFQKQAREIAALDLYRRFYATGWTPKLTRDIRRELAPRMVRIVTLAWYAALDEADMLPEAV